MTSHVDFFAALDALLDSTGLPTDVDDVPTGAGRTRVTSWGPETAPATVLLHGHGATSGSWAPLVPHLARTQRLHAIDLIGDAGRSQADRPPRRPEDLFGWLDDVVRWTGRSRVGLVGHSYGAWLACSYALSRPEIVDRLVLVDPTNCFGSLSARYVLRALPFLLRPSPARWHSFLTWETAGTSVDRRWAEVAGLATSLPRARVVRPRRPTHDQLAGMSCPTLVLVADRGRAHDPAALARTAASYPAVTVAHLESASHHSIPAAQADQIAAAMLSHQGAT
ncbi:alpha/beta fold hydrolase [Nocardioides sp. CER19]|uniref:alpha/beta fold hydrolase n=1 Tax=Nocardioides sp. CER19 TaxID=3038538 RepID=UPI002449CA27|nr:alpha/beta fold hydrolase [Nocardioides sp. CER19]MDH2416201.1 alpha/beta fold hydrolase [Nocardioides sp. CER19]